MRWTDERTDLAVKLWAEGMSASLIAARMGNGFTRNAVIGRIHRLGLARREKTPVSRSHRNKLRKARLRREGRFLRKPQSLSERILMIPHDPLPKDDAAPPGATSLIDMHEHQCRWPYGTHDYLFCPRNKLPGLPYCEAHVRKGYRVEEIVQRGHPKMAEKFETVVERETV